MRTHSSLLLDEEGIFPLGGVGCYVKFVFGSCGACSPLPPALPLLSLFPLVPHIAATLFLIPALLIPALIP